MLDSWCDYTILPKSTSILQIAQGSPTQNEIVPLLSKYMDREKQTHSFSLLTKELVMKILDYLEPIDIIKFARTCKFHRRISYDESLWQRIVYYKVDGTSKYKHLRILFIVYF